MKAWNELSRKEQLAATHYDFYKDVHGVRPRWYDYDAMTEQMLEKELDELARQSEEQERERKIAEQAAVEVMETRIQGLINGGAKTREDAVRWLHDAHDTNGDGDYLCYLLGLPYGYFDTPTAGRVI